VPANVGSFAHRGENVVDLMDALRRSIGTAEPAKAAKPSKKPCKAVSGQKEMLMPIAGKSHRRSGNQEAGCQVTAQIGTRDLLRGIDELFQVSNDSFRRRSGHWLKP
jgi:hypothetical protein